MSGFTLDIKNFVEKAKKNPETVARQVSFKLFSAVIKASPVDTGRFRMNWQTAGAVAPSGVIDAVDESGNRIKSALSITSPKFDLRQIPALFRPLLPIALIAV